MSAHYYDADGNLVPPWTPDAYPSVSTILDRVKSDEYDALVRRLGQEDADKLMSVAAERGTRIHAATHEYEVGNPNYRAYLEDGEDGYVQGYLNWREEQQPKLVASELFVTSEKHGYRGRLDRVFILSDGNYWIIDVKTGQDNVRHGLQLKLYQQAYYEMTGIKARMGVLALDAKLKCGYRNSRKPLGIQEYKEPWAPALAHINVFKWWAKKRPIKQPVDADAIWKTNG